jgi:vancomycin resistance protein VanW
LKKGDEYFRSNEIWRTKHAKFQSGRLLDEELMFKNFGRVKYVPEDYLEI